jgi:hypothetical protein
VTQVISVSETTTTLVAASPPKLTVEPERKSVPMIVTGVPPNIVPLFGVTLMTVTAGAEAAPKAAATHDQ